MKKMVKPVLQSLFALVLWVVLYSQLLPLADFLTGLLPFDPKSHEAEAVRYFLYDGPKVILLLALVIFVMGVVRSFFTPEHTRKVLAGKKEGVGNVMAALLGVVTPFCSCSAVPMFIGFLSAGVPLGVTFSFLIAAPMVNEIALGLLWALVGWKAALLYMAFGLLVAIISGTVLGKLGLERWLEDWVRDLRQTKESLHDAKISWSERVQLGVAAVRDIVGKIWLWVLAGVGVGALIHGYVPTDFLAYLMGPSAWWSVPLAVVVGIPLYANPAAILPVATALLGKGAALGTVLAFMMSVTALSLPEMIILRKVLKKKLIGVFVGVVASGILIAGYLFNLLL
ncbi:MAG TPA: hypothetical protein DD400_02460 [Rhodospirillaceae bacterium]|nr:hypothetical protein [Rhodospirillaceae bacterium]